MPQQNPAALLLKMGDGADPEVFGVICGLTTRTFNLNGALVDTTTFECDGSTETAWQRMAQGIQKLDISGNGFFDSKAQFTRLYTSKVSGQRVNLEVIVPNFGTFTGTFNVGDLSLGAEVAGGSITQSLSFMSHGPVTFTPEA